MVLSSVDPEMVLSSIEWILMQTTNSLFLTFGYLSYSTSGHSHLTSLIKKTFPPGWLVACMSGCAAWIILPTARSCCCCCWLGCRPGRNILVRSHASEAPKTNTPADHSRLHRLMVKANSDGFLWLTSCFWNICQEILPDIFVIVSFCTFIFICSAFCSRKLSLLLHGQ